jgi:hypothetical protein
MTRPHVGKARRLAVERVVSALRAKLAGAITTAKAESTTPTIFLPAPPDEAIIAGDPEDPEQVVRNHPVVCFVWPGSRRVVSESSGGLTTYGAMFELDMEVVMLFQAGMPERLTDADGVALEQEAEMRRRAELYTEAIITTVLTYGCFKNANHQIRLESDDALAIYLDERGGGTGPLGIAAATFTITQKCDVPSRIESLA